MSKEAVDAVRVGIEDALNVFESLSVGRVGSSERLHRLARAGRRSPRGLELQGDGGSLTTTAEPLPPMPAERLMDLLVEPRRDWTPEQVLTELRTYAPRPRRTLDAMQEPPLATSPLTVADLGTYEMQQLADAYAFDLYCHLRVDVLAPHGPIERDIPPADDLRIRPAVGWMLAGLPQMQGDAFAFVDRSIGLRLDGPGGGEWLISPAEGDRIAVEASTAANDVAAVIRSSADAFVMWGTKRSDWRESTELDGDLDLASRFLDTLNIV